MRLIEDENGKIIIVKNTREKIAELKQKLTDSDYLPHKLIDGFLTKEEYEPMRLQRQQWRDEINKLEEELKESK